jgi:hypothetical protein
MGARVAAVGVALFVVASVGAQSGAARGKPHHRARLQLTNLSVSFDGPQFVPVGGQSAYRLTVRNAGPNRATGASVYVSVPAAPLTLVPVASAGCKGGPRWAICKVGVVRPGHARSVSVTFAAAAPDIVQPQAVVLAKQIDLDIADNIATTTVALQPSPALADVSVRISPYPGVPSTTVPGGEPYTQVTVTNGGPGQALRTVVQFTLPEGGRFKEYSYGPTAECAHGFAWDQPDDLSGLPVGSPKVMMGSLRFCIPRLMPGESRSYVESVALPPNSTWIASAKAATPDPDPKNNFAVADAAGRSCGCPQPIGG